MTKSNRDQPSFSSHVRAILTLPFLVTIIIPALWLIFFPAKTLWNLTFPMIVIPMITGLVMAGCGFFIFNVTIKMFHHVGKGTLAPWAPPKKLVVQGIYSYMRNPMITGVLCLLMSETILFGSLALLVWTILFFIMNTIYFIVSEEPALAKRFGQEYKDYKANVPRWIPRRRPWKE